MKNNPQLYILTSVAYFINIGMLIMHNENSPEVNIPKFFLIFVVNSYISMYFSSKILFLTSLKSI